MTSGMRLERRPLANRRHSSTVIAVPSALARVMRQHDHLSEFARRFIEETCPGRFRVCSEEIGVNQITLGAVSWYPTLASVTFGADRKRIRGELAARSSTSSTYGKGESAPFFREELAAGVSNYIYTYGKGEAA
ncbi:uncharacterized protein [Lolium perenne]|uniref:uncharacterized protein n=1 Tax=Lolium perenne TaxID=4522 RepID=UPI0021EA372D|nr:uncharacterized protein LOC127342211 [Lolium perenne]XP_051224123.1 uncharacterized protein LOC127342211 [Lolium perenne]